MRLDAADGVKDRARRFDDLVLNESIKRFFDPPIYHWKASFCVPCNMEMRFGINGVGHRC